MTFQRQKMASAKPGPLFGTWRAGVLQEAHMLPNRKSGLLAKLGYRLTVWRAIFAAILASGLVFAAFVAAQSDSRGDAGGASYSEVQAFIERQNVEGFPLDEVVSSALELGYKPVLIAAVLSGMKFDPVVVAVTLVGEGVARDVAAAAVITVADPVVAPAVKAAVSAGASPSEIKAIEVVSSPTKKEAAPTSSNVAASQSGKAPAGSPPVPVPEQKAPSATQSGPTPVLQQPQPTEPVVPIVLPIVEPVQQPLPETVPQPVFEPVAPITPVITLPIMGGGGGATRN